MDEKWHILKPNIKVKRIPRFGELIYLGDLKIYYKVLNVIHYVNGNEGVFIVIQEYKPEMENYIEFSG